MSGINDLAKILQGRINESGVKPQNLDFGLIMDDLSLKINKFPLPIPPENYLACRSVSLDPDVPLTSTWRYEGCPDCAHDHNVFLPQKMFRLQPGDRVLVAWAGDEPVVIDVLAPAR